MNVMKSCSTFTTLEPLGGSHEVMLLQIRLLYHMISNLVSHAGESCDTMPKVMHSPIGQAHQASLAPSTHARRRLGTTRLVKV